jgi:hypothetical protein
MNPGQVQRDSEVVRGAIAQTMRDPIRLQTTLKELRVLRCDQQELIVFRGRFLPIHFGEPAQAGVPRCPVHRKLKILTHLITPPDS